MLSRDIIEQARPPDPDTCDMIEAAFLGYQVDALTYALAEIWLRQFRCAARRC